MEIVFLIVGLIFCVVGGFLIYFDKRPDNTFKCQGEIIGYAQDGKIYNAILKFRSRTGVTKYGKWPIGSSAFTHFLGEKVSLYESLQYQDRVWPESRGLKIAAWFFFLAGAGLIFLFTHIYDPNPINLGISAFILLTMFFRGYTKFEKAKGKMEKSGVSIHSFFEEAKKKAYTIDVFSSLDEASFRLLDKDELYKNEKTQLHQTQVSRGILLTLALLGLSGSGYWIKYRYEFLLTALPTQAKVVGMKTVDSDDGYTYAPIYKFKPQGLSENVEVVSKVSSSHPTVRRGDKVIVLYDPNDYKSILLDEGPYLNYMAPAIAMGFSLFFLFLSLLIRKKRVKSVPYNKYKSAA